MPVNDCRHIEIAEGGWCGRKIITKTTGSGPSVRRSLPKSPKAVRPKDSYGIYLILYCEGTVPGLSGIIKLWPG